MVKFDWLMRVFGLISLLILALGLSVAALATSENEAFDTVMLEILEGDTAFLVEMKEKRVWWIVGECRRNIPIDASSSSETLMSRMIVEDVTLGSRQIKLRQQFRFDLASTPPSVSVFNSVRSGWSPVPVERNDACTLQPGCRARMELPEC